MSESKMTYEICPVCEGKETDCHVCRHTPGFVPTGLTMAQIERFRDSHERWESLMFGLEPILGKANKSWKGIFERIERLEKKPDGPPVYGPVLRDPNELSEGERQRLLNCLERSVKERAPQ